MKGILSAALKKARENASLTATSVAEGLNISVAAWSQYEKGIRDPGLDMIYKICQVLSVDPNTLFGLTNPSTSSLSVRGSGNAIAASPGATATVSTFAAVNCTKCPYKKLAQKLEKLGLPLQK